MGVVPDASALLAFLHRESGGERVPPLLDGARVSTVNWAEVVQKAVERGVETDGMREGFVELGVVFEPFTADHAETAALLRARTRERGLSLADRACLALALDRGLRVVTADRAWAELGLEVEVELIR